MSSAQQWPPPQQQPGWSPSAKNSGKTWLILLAVLVVAGVVYVIGAAISANKADTQDWATKVATQLTEKVGSKVDVTCPDSEPVKKGYIFDCTATDSTGVARIVRITEDDDQGHFTYLVTDQQP